MLLLFSNITDDLGVSAQNVSFYFIFSFYVKHVPRAISTDKGNTDDSDNDGEARHILPPPTIHGASRDPVATTTPNDETSSV